MRKIMRKIISTMLVLSMLFATDCSANGVSSEAVSNQSGSTPIKVIDESVSTSISSAVDVSASHTAKPVFDMKAIQGKVKNIYYDDGSKAIVSADKLYSYDLAKGKVLAEADLPVTDISFVQPIKDGYVVIGEDIKRSGGGMMATGNSSAQCVFYDKNLKLISTIVLSDIHKTDRLLPFSEAIAVSDDGNKLAFPVSYEGLYIYDISKKQKTLILDLKADIASIKGISGLEKVDFVNGDKTIAFLADTFDIPIVNGAEGYNTCGRIDVDGAGLVNTKTGDYSIYEMTNVYDGFALYSEDFTNPTGRFLKMDTKTGKTEFLKASEKKETGYVVGSDNGAYYSTALRSNGSWLIRIYDTKTNKLISEQKAEFGEEIYGYRIPSVKLIDATKTCIILLGHTQSAEYPTKVFVSQF